MRAYRHIAIVLSILLLTLLAHAQTEWTVILNGKVLEAGKPLSRAILILKKNGEDVQKVVTAPNGKFNITLYSDNDYDLYFTKKGYVTKFISYSTKNVPEDKIDGIYSEFIFELELFKEMEGLNTSILDFPVFKVKYYPGLKNLEYDKKHESKIKSRMNTLLKEYKAAEIKRKLDAKRIEDRKKQQQIEKAYNEQLAVADVFFKEMKYEESQDAYEKALVIMPNKDFPRDRIVAIEKLIKSRDKTTKLPEAMEARYATFITSANAKFLKKQYASAKSLYKRASLIAPDRPYPKTQIALAEEEIAKSQSIFNAAKDEKYKITIDRAENEFMGEDYVRARNSFLLASKVKPEELYPKKRMQEIDSIVAANKIVPVTTPHINNKKPKVKKVTKANTVAVKRKDKMKDYLLALATKYDEGITEEIEVEADKKITRIIVLKMVWPMNIRRKCFHGPLIIKRIIKSSRSISSKMKRKNEHIPR